MRFILALIAVAAITSSAKADPLKPARVIEITKENADRSAQLIASSKSALWGMPPKGRLVLSDANWRNAHAEAQRPKITQDKGILRLNESKLTAIADEALGRARVQIIRPSKAGPVVETYLVPKQ